MPTELKKNGKLLRVHSGKCVCCGRGSLYVNLARHAHRETHSTIRIDQLNTSFIAMTRKKLVKLTFSMGVPLKIHYKDRSQSPACVYGSPNQAQRRRKLSTSPPAEQRPKTLKTGLSWCRAVDHRVEGIRLGPRNQAKNPPTTNDARGGRMRQQDIGGALLAFRYKKIVHHLLILLTVGRAFVQLATALLVGH